MLEIKTDDILRRKHEVKIEGEVYTSTYYVNPKNYNGIFRIFDTMQQGKISMPNAIDQIMRLVFEKEFYIKMDKLLKWHQKLYLLKPVIFEITGVEFDKDNG